MTIQGYVAGLMVHPATESVVLIKKRRPEWMAGKLNAPGGKVEEGEFPREAMSREYYEETGVWIGPDVWGPPLVSLHGADQDNQAFVVDFFRFSAPFHRLEEAHTKTDERIEVYTCLNPRDLLVRALPNLSWIIPLAMYAHDSYETIVALEKNA